MNSGKIKQRILIGGVAVGAGALTAYLADPEVGDKRRARLVTNTKRLLQRVGQDAKISLRDTGHRLAGMAASLRSQLRADQPSPEVLEQRIRSRIGRVISRPQCVHVLCDRGLTILWGTVPKNEIYPVLHAVREVPGVHEIQEHLETSEPEHLSEGCFDSLNQVNKAIRLNWSPSKRLFVGGVGAALTIYGLRKKAGVGKASILLGAGLITRSLMRKKLEPTLALTEESPGFELEKTIRIDCAISDLFTFWANPENYPKVFSHILGIERLGENLYRWRMAGPGGVPVTLEGMITRSVPNTLIEWKSLPGSTVGNLGFVRLDPLYDGSTRVRVRMFYRPPAGIVGRFVAELFGSDPGHFLDQDLGRLKTIFEKRPRAEGKTGVQEHPAEDALRMAGL